MTSLKDYTSDLESNTFPLKQFISDAVTVFIQAAQQSQDEEVKNMFNFHNMKDKISIPISEEEYNERIETKMKAKI
jgi:hypothetical protein